MAERYELLVPEHPGLGGSDDPSWINSMADLAMFYLDLVEEAGLDRIHLTLANLRWQPCWFNPDLEKWLHRIKLPALVVWGDDDKIMPPANAALWRERLPDARLVMVSECGHLPLVEQASLVARHVREFLEGVAP